MADNVYTRRDFIKGVGAAGLALGIPATLNAGTAPADRAKVVLVRNAAAVTAEGALDAAVITKMLDHAVCALAGNSDAVAAWKHYLKPEDTLGIKTNVWRNLPTPPALEQAIKARALAVGIPEAKISIRDRGLLADPLFTGATALVNIRPLRTHHWAGIGGCLKNYITFHNNPASWHDDSCADLGGLWKMPVCAGKTRLNILVCLTPQFYGIGPHHFDPKNVWPYGGLLVSEDPVAVDSLGVTLLEEKRKIFFERPPRGGTSTKHVYLAETRHGIGIADRARIDIIRLGDMEGALI